MNLKKLLSVFVIFCALAALGCQRQNPAPSAAESEEMAAGLKTDALARAKALIAKGNFELEEFEIFPEIEGGTLWLVDPGTGRPGSVTGYTLDKGNVYFKQYTAATRGTRISFKPRQNIVGEDEANEFSHLEPVFKPTKPTWAEARRKP